MDHETTSIVWLKRDLRLRDHAPLNQALLQPHKILLWYCFEPILYDDPHYSDRHFKFVQDSLDDLNKQLRAYDSSILITEGDPTCIMYNLKKQLGPLVLYSHEETGIGITYKRDRKMKKVCHQLGITWNEYQSNGITRGRRNRDNWMNDWYDLMTNPVIKVNLNTESLHREKDINTLHEQLNANVSRQWIREEDVQIGGESYAYAILDSFVNDRIKNYSSGISKPAQSRTSCSRLSPHLAWGNLSIRQVFRTAAVKKQEGKLSRQFSAFMSRLRWHDHFIQKFEMECSMEYQSYNRAYTALDKPINSHYVKAWQEGKTGYPMVDACMRCLNTTGYINFRMRAMMVSFFTANLWQPWQAASPHLAKQFLDFEPGIHFPQLQMQAGTTGANTIRMYNPVKQSQDHDPDGSFIKKWIPELISVPVVHIHEPWKMTLLDQQFCNVIIGTDYPAPIVDLATSTKRAKDILYGFRNRPDVRQEAKRIIAKHTIGGEERPNQ